jgi:hypothetical protein
MMWGPYHAGHTPNVGAGTPFSSQYNLGRSILSGLNVVGEMVAHPACVAQVGNLDGNDAGIDLVFTVPRRALVKRNTRHFSLQEITATR